MESHPLRMRGLKRRIPQLRNRPQTVASFTDAWIETRWWVYRAQLALSHPLRMRGLKHPLTTCRPNPRICRILYGCVDWNRKVNWLVADMIVASFTDAWIETQRWSVYVFGQWVASFTDAWIETISINLLINALRSHPLRMRGLKQAIKTSNRDFNRVASFTDAWIETVRQGAGSLRSIVASFTDAWIETSSNRRLLRIAAGRILYGCVDWNSINTPA